MERHLCLMIENPELLESLCTRHEMTLTEVNTKITPVRNR